MIIQSTDKLFSVQLCLLFIWSQFHFTNINLHYIHYTLTLILADLCAQSRSALTFQFVELSFNLLFVPQESNIVYRDEISISMRPKVSTACETIRPINVCAKQKAESIHMWIHRWYQNYGNSLPNTIKSFMNWSVRIWDGQRNRMHWYFSKPKK